MAEWEHAVNAYEVLGLAQGPKATDAEISKAYRAAALRYHPDKNKGDVEGAKNKFQAAKDARDLLSDAKARAALDALLSARAAREAKFAGQDEKRRRMREKLERDEKAAATGRNEEAEARSRLQAELGRLKREAAARRAAQQAAQQAAQPAAQQSAEAAAGAAATAAAAAADAPPVITEDLLRTLKVSWSVKAGGYTSQQLRDAFAADGPVEDVILRASKRKSKGSALVVMKTRAAAAAAAAAPHGDPANPLLVVPFLKVPVEATANSSPAAPEPAQQSAAAASQAANGHGSAAAAAAAGSAADPHARNAAPLFPLDDAATAGPGSANGWAAGKPQAPLFPSFGDANGAAAASSPSATATPQGSPGDAAQPMPTASSFRMPAASSFRPPPGGLFNAGIFGAVTSPLQKTDGAAEADKSQRADASNGTAGGGAAAGRQQAGGAAAAQAAAQAPPSAAASRPGQMPQVNGRAYETPAEANLRRAAERARLIAEMEAEDAAEAVV